jgi:DNA replication complex GINS protein SLD5 C-terminus
MIAEPNLDVFVVCRVLEDVGAIEHTANAPQLELRKGDEYVIRYRPIRQFVLEGSIELM